MSSRKSSSNMLPSRTRLPSAAQQKPRHIPTSLPQSTAVYTQYLSNMAEPNYHVVPSASIYFPEMTSCLPVGDDTSFPGNDGSYIPTSGVAPTDLTFIHPLGPCDSDTSSSSSEPLAKPFSPPMTEAEIAQAELYHTTGIDSGMAHLSCYPDQWVMQLPPTPPADPMFEIPDMFDTGRTDSLAFEPLPEPATECEYLGVSKLQFSRSDHLIRYLMLCIDFV